MCLPNHMQVCSRQSEDPDVEGKLVLEQESWARGTGVIPGQVTPT